MSLPWWLSGVALVWVTKKYVIEEDIRGGQVFRLGDPVETRWYAEGRRATREEVEASVASGIHLIEQEARGPRELRAIAEARKDAERFFPPSSAKEAS